MTDEWQIIFTRLMRSLVLDHVDDYADPVRDLCSIIAESIMKQRLGSGLSLTQNNVSEGEIIRALCRSTAASVLSTEQNKALLDLVGFRNRFSHRYVERNRLWITNRIADLPFVIRDSLTSMHVLFGH
jgi:hypothetical protein